MSLSTIRRWLRPWIARQTRRKAIRIAERAEKKRAVLMQQIAERKSGHREWKPLLGDLRKATHAALAAEIGRG